MKTLKVNRTQWLRGALCISLLSAWAASGADPTAFELIKEGNRFLGEQSKDKVLEIRSDKSILDLTPVIWYVVYFDPDAVSKRVQVKFGAGREMGISRNWRPFGGGGSADKVLDAQKLKVDSNQAIKTATAEPLIAKLTIKATQLWLENTGAAPTWKVRLWAAKLSHPDAMVDIGEIFISAESGQVVKSDLHINRVE
jgi:hypothetical protein